jgi:lysozyme family protein
MAIKTLDVNALTSETESIYETVVIMSKRARQVSTQAKAELDEKLAYYEGFGTETETPRMIEEQVKLSLQHETKPKPAEVAVEEMHEREIYYRNPNAE